MKTLSEEKMKIIAQTMYGTGDWIVGRTNIMYYLSMTSTELSHAINKKDLQVVKLRGYLLSKISWLSMWLNKNKKKTYIRTKEHNKRIAESMKRNTNASNKRKASEIINCRY